MQRPPLGSPHDRLPTTSLRVFRVDPGSQVVIRTLSPRYSGLFCHWDRRRSILCQGADCPPQVHRCQKLWKGYTLVEVYDQPYNKWLPTVLEITEHLELDFRGVYQRGQVWELSRLAQTSKKATPVKGKLLEVRDERTFPPCFSFLPVLLTVYHAEKIDLTQTNPLPDRIMVQPSEGSAPDHVVKALDEKPVDGKTMQEFLRRFREGFGGEK